MRALADPSEVPVCTVHPEGINSEERGDSPLVRTLGPVQLVLLGVGCIIGAGIYVMTGVVAADYAGPAVVFALAAVACSFAALC
jgi:APA family basic amino acid/polyamine antiporter